MSGWCVRVSGDVSIPNPFARDYVRSDIAFSSNALFYIKLPMSGGIWMVSGWCLDGVWMVSGDVWMVSGWCLDGPTVILDAAKRVLMPKQVISVTVLSYAIFFQWPRRGLFPPKIWTPQNANLARKECSNQKV